MMSYLKQAKEIEVWMPNKEAQLESIARSLSLIEEHLMAPARCDANLEYANITDAVYAVADALFAVAKAIKGKGDKGDADALFDEIQF
jgi:hypothetical protein